MYTMPWQPLPQPSSPSHKFFLTKQAGLVKIITIVSGLSIQVTAVILQGFRDQHILNNSI